MSSNIPQNLIQEWLALKGKEATAFYFEHILESVVASLKERCPEEIRNANCDCLVSLMGFSPETTVLAAAAVRPKRLYVVTGEKTEENYDLAHQFLVKHHILKHSQIRLESIHPDHPSEIYEAIDSITSSHHCMVDVTGGKKIMSATAGQVAWEKAAQLCYIDGDYDPVLRRPWPGSERIVLLLNPSQERGRKLRERALEAWKMRLFQPAVRLFMDSQDINKDHGLEEIAIPLCKAFAAQRDFKLPELEAAVEDLKKISERPYVSGIVKSLKLDQTLAAFQSDPGMKLAQTRIAAFLAMAETYAEQQRHDFASLLAYRAIEAAVQEGLRQKSSTGEFDMNAPPWNSLNLSDENLKHRYCELSREIDSSEKQEQALPGRLGLMSGFCVLAILDETLVPRLFPTTNTNVKPTLVSVAVRKVQEVADMRNRSILAHGAKTLGRDDYQQIFQLAKRIATVVLEAVDIEALLAGFLPPKLEEWDK